MLRVFRHCLGVSLGLRVFRLSHRLRVFCHSLGLRVFRHCLGVSLGLRVFRHCLGLSLGRSLGVSLSLGASDHFVRLAVVVLHHVQQMLRGLQHGVGRTFGGSSLVFRISVHEALPIFRIHLFELCHMLFKRRLRWHGAIDDFQLSVSL